MVCKSLKRLYHYSVTRTIRMSEILPGRVWAARDGERAPDTALECWQRDKPRAFKFMDCSGR